MIITAGLVAVTACLLPGGMRGLTWIRVALYVIVAAAFLLPIVWISATRANIPVPQVSYGLGALQYLEAVSQEYLNQGFSSSAAFAPVFAGADIPGIAASLIVIATIAAGIASMPQVLQHFSTSHTPAAARYTGSWSCCSPLVSIASAFDYRFCNPRIFRSKCQMIKYEVVLGI